MSFCGDLEWRDWDENHHLTTSSTKLKSFDELSPYMGLSTDENEAFVFFGYFDDRVARVLTWRLRLLRTRF